MHNIAQASLLLREWHIDWNCTVELQHLTFWFYCKCDEKEFRSQLSKQKLQWKWRWSQRKSKPLLQRMREKLWSYAGCTCYQMLANQGIFTSEAKGEYLPNIMRYCENQTRWSGLTCWRCSFHPAKSIALSRSVGIHPSECTANKNSTTILHGEIKTKNFGTNCYRCSSWSNTWELSPPYLWWPQVTTNPFARIAANAPWEPWIVWTPLSWSWTIELSPPKSG